MQNLRYDRNGQPYYDATSDLLGGLESEMLDVFGISPTGEEREGAPDRAEVMERLVRVRLER